MTWESILFILLYSGGMVALAFGIDRLSKWILKKLEQMAGEETFFYKEEQHE
jgi:hypothetical protein